MGNRKREIVVIETIGIEYCTGITNLLNFMVEVANSLYRHNWKVLISETVGS